MVSRALVDQASLQEISSSSLFSFNFRVVRYFLCLSSCFSSIQLIGYVVLTIVPLEPFDYCVEELNHGEFMWLLHFCLSLVHLLFDLF